MTDFVPLRRMQERIELEKGDSNSAYFLSLLYGYELVTKLTTAAFVAAIGDDTDRHRYRLEHLLVHASGIGDWGGVINQAFAGPASAHLDHGAYQYRDEINTKVGSDRWQFEASRLLRRSLIELGIETEPHPAKCQLLQWFKDFSLLRNKTRGHGAPAQSSLDSACGPFGESLSMVIDNLTLFKAPWAFVRRNLNGKYRVCHIAGDEKSFVHLKSNRDLNYDDGVYIALDVLRQVRLLHTDQDLSDFYIANGGFTGKRHEVLSYITGEVEHMPSQYYLKPVEALPGSVTEGSEHLNIIGNVLSNLPAPPQDYVSRPALEEELARELVNAQHHPIVTLDGRGGIGKTSTALQVISRLAESSECPYGTVLWFSARDIDLMPEGAKLVRPSGVTVEDFAEQYAMLMELPNRTTKAFNAREEFGKALASKGGEPVLFVFDNFETVVSPAELFAWLDSFVRQPNKVLITTRIRGNFRADFPIHVGGMSDAECISLIKQTAQRIGVHGVLTQEFINDLVEESEGHPYVIKVLLGEVARTPRVRKVARVIASRDDILAALFERTFDALSPAARRVFLTLAGWRSIVPELAVEAVLIRPGNEKIDIRSAVEDLVNSSLVDEIVSIADEYFLSVPLAAQVFGQAKLEASPYRGSIIEDIKLLQQFGAAQKYDVGRDVAVRLNTLFRNIAALVATKERTLDECLPTIEYVARKMPQAWLLLADLCEGEMPNPEEYVRNCLLRYLERDGKDDSRAWKRLADSFSSAGLVSEEINALVGLSRSDGIPIYLVSNAVRRVNSILASSKYLLDADDRRQLVKELAGVAASRVSECNATDLSRLAWLFLSLQDVASAAGMVRRGLEIEPNNEYCLNLNARLGAHS
jgi:NB-ARC domain